jgi:hypothetical protein
MAGSGLNHNMNHVVKRIETRVLQPPGGASSFSIGGGGYGGGYGNTDYSHSSSNRSRNNNSHREASNSNSNYREPTNQNVSSNARSLARKDSLDDLVQCNIPGLEGHYDSRQRGSGSMLSSVGIPPSNAKQTSRDYAAQLKAQIDNKASLHQEEYGNPFGRSGRGFDSKDNSFRGSAPNSRESGDSAYGSSKRSSFASAASGDYSSNGGPHTSTRVRAPPGGQTSFSIGWN